MRRPPSAIVSLLAATLLLTGCPSGPPEDSSDATPSAPEAGSSSPTDESPELIGGGAELFPDRRFVGLYGHPGSPALGALGEQGPQESVQRVTEMAGEYEPHSDQPVYPAFEIITTMASSEPGADGDYSSETDVEDLEPYLDAAQENGVYVILDLQPGRTDFLTQAKMYEDVLKRPNVGLGLDPEWRLESGQEHMDQIGSVDAAEVNETTEWLAELTRDHDLPQKMVVLHQFNRSMIRNRGTVRTDHPELAMVLHADGHGTPDDKKETWKRLQEELPGDMRMAWKNFYDEDQPTFSPRQTFEMEPTPWLVTYQ